MPSDNIITSQVRAKAIYMEDERTDKAGRTHKVRQHVMPMDGMYSGVEAEREAVRMAADLGVDESKMRVETYDIGKAPMESNPRHRGLPKSFENRSRTKQMVRHDKQRELGVRTRSSFAGIEYPDPAEFEARRAAAAARLDALLHP